MAPGRTARPVPRGYTLIELMVVLAVAAACCLALAASARIREVVAALTEAFSWEANAAALAAISVAADSVGWGRAPRPGATAVTRSKLYTSTPL